MAVPPASLAAAPGKHCSYDKARLFRGTFVFESQVGKVPLETGSPGSASYMKVSS
jgi:hypothetical protein